MTTPRSIHRPELHVTPEVGVLDAPAGALLDRDTWHLFVQFRPRVDKPARWGHIMGAENPFEWEFCDDVLAPEGDEVMVRAGSVVADGQALNIYYTSVRKSGPNQDTAIGLARIEDVNSIGHEVADDPSFVDPNVERVGIIIDDMGDYENFRSPCVVPDWISQDDRDEGHEGWLMLAVTGSSDHPVPVMLRSDDGRTWEFLGPWKIEGTSGLEDIERVVSPRIVRLRDEVDNRIYDVVLVTCEQDGVDISGYLVGRFEGNSFQVTTPFTSIDQGHDFVRPRNTNVTPGTVPTGQRYERAMIFGLLNGIGRFDDPTLHLSLRAEGWANCLSFPRLITLQGGKIYQTPPPGLTDAIADTKHAAAWIGLCDVPEGSALKVEILDGADRVCATVTHRGDTLTLDRSMNPHHRDEGPLDEPAVATLEEGDTDSLSIFVDGSTVEVFADGGMVAMASRVYFDGGTPRFEVEESGEARILRAFQHFPHDFSSAGLPEDFGEYEGPVR